MSIPDSLLGKQIDQFRIEKYIARGAMGIVFKAFDTVLARPVALKIIPKGAEDGLDDMERFSRVEARKRLIQEAKAAGRLSHPNIVTIHCYGETDALQYICMELVQGKTLNQILGERKALSEQEAIAILMQVLSALEAANREDIVHRDIKPSNIMITEGTRVKVMDFGIAKLPSLSMTVTGMILGTPFYMSPEQISGRKVDIRSDIFSTGAVLYELLTGQKPFPGDTTATLTYKILQTDPLPPDAVNAAISPPMSEITLRALAKDPADRYQTPTEMINALRRQQERLLAHGGEIGETLAGPARDAYAATVRSDRVESGKVAHSPSVPSPSPPNAVHEPEQPGPSGHPEAFEPLDRDEAGKPLKAGEYTPHVGSAMDHAKSAASLSAGEAQASPRGPLKDRASSRALGAGALLLLLTAAGFIVYVTLRPSGPPPAPPVSPGTVADKTDLPAPPPTAETPGAGPPRADYLDSLLLEAGRSFVNNPAMARKLLVEALAINPAHFESLLMMARLSTYQKDFKDAMARYETALGVNSQSGEAYFELGCLQVAEGQYQAAVRSLEACLALAPRNRDDVLTNLGFAYWKLNKLEEATRCYQEALTYNPQNDRARALLTSLPPPSAQPGGSTFPTPLPPISKLDGKYAVEGVNPNGSRYHGTATLTQSGSKVTMKWSIGGRSHSGSGSVSGNRLTLTWKGSTGEGGVVVYTLAADGALKGVWANGKGSETLTPLR